MAEDLKSSIVNFDELKSVYGVELGSYIAMCRGVENMTTHYGTSSYHGEHDWESKRSRSTTPLYSLYRRDGTVIPCCHERYIAFNANYSAEKPELEKEHYIKRAGIADVYFHFRSGFLLRSEDHDHLRYEVSQWLWKRNLFENPDSFLVHTSLLDMFWPGPTAFAMRGCSARKLPPFSEKRVAVSMDYMQILWNHVEKTRKKHHYLKPRLETFHYRRERQFFLKYVDDFVNHQVREYFSSKVDDGIDLESALKKEIDGFWDLI